MGLHRQGPLYQNKDVLGLIAKQVKYQTTSSKWGEPSILQSIQRNVKSFDPWVWVLFFSFVVLTLSISLLPSSRPKDIKNHQFDISSVGGGECPPPISTECLPAGGFNTPAPAPVPFEKWRGSRRNFQRLVNKRSSALPEK
jgi:hypothetical protein